jgi:PAS domain S-box-containing protein
MFMTGPAATTVALESILFTEELNSRPSRPPDYQKENRALIALVMTLADSPADVLQTLADAILELLDCGSAGISLLTLGGGERFYWPAIAGVWKPYIGGGTPRDFGPCGDVLDCNKPLLFKHIERRYTYFDPIKPAVEEALLVPFYVAGTAVGTVWAVTHDYHRQFDAEDKRQLETLARFASAAYQSATSRDVSRQLAAIVESSDDAIIGKNLNGVITSWNSSAERLFGYSAEEVVGQNITLIIPPDRRDEEPKILQQLRQGERVDHFETVRVRKDGKLLDISITVSPVKDDLGRVVGASKVARDISERKRAEEARKDVEFSAKLLKVQDAERRRIARELHDGVGQLVIAIKLNVSQVYKEKYKLSSATARYLKEAFELVGQAIAEIRMVSYLLHPPLLEEIGLVSALEWYTNGFAERSKVKVSLELSSGLGRLPQDYELSLFRVAQECLTNIHRHSESSTATVKLTRSSKEITLEVRDAGKGIDKHLQSKIASGATIGVGFRGMQERVKLIGGNLAVKSSDHGTSVAVTLPISWMNGAEDCPGQQATPVEPKQRFA